MSTLFAAVAGLCALFIVVKHADWLIGLAVYSSLLAVTSAIESTK